MPEMHPVQEWLPAYKTEARAIEKVDIHLERGR